MHGRNAPCWSGVISLYLLMIDVIEAQSNTDTASTLWYDSVVKVADKLFILDNINILLPSFHLPFHRYKCRYSGDLPV